jgi:hypothetical protein
MRTRSFVGGPSRSFLAIVLAGCGLFACTTQEVTPDGGGGSGGGGGTGGGGGGSSQYPPSDGVACPTPTTATITDFTYTAGAVMDQVTFGDFTTTFSGGQYYYPNAGMPYPLTSDVTGSNWHLTTQMVGAYSGFGLYFNNCGRIDASAFRGISFTISGMVQGGSVTVEIDTLKNAIAPSWLSTHGGMPMAFDGGHCVPNPSATNQYAQTDCVQPTTNVMVTETPTTRTVLWSDLMGGKPDLAPKPTEITGIRWRLPPPVGVDTPNVVPYPLDIVVDNLSFVQ